MGGSRARSARSAWRRGIVQIGQRAAAQRAFAHVHSRGNGQLLAAVGADGPAFDCCGSKTHAAPLFLTSLCFFMRLRTPCLLFHGRMPSAGQVVLSGIGRLCLPAGVGADQPRVVTESRPLPFLFGQVCAAAWTGMQVALFGKDHHRAGWAHPRTLARWPAFPAIRVAILTRHGRTCFPNPDCLLGCRVGGNGSRPHALAP